MAWEAFVKLREDSNDVGIVTCVWNSGEADEFTYSRPALVSAAEKAKIVVEAHEALIARDARVVKETSLSNIVTNALNA